MNQNKTSSGAATDYFSWMAGAADKWATHAQNVASKVQQGSYSRADAAKDFGQCMAMAIEYSSSYVSMMSQYFSAAASSTSATSEVFSTASAGTAELGLTFSVSLTEALTGVAIADTAVTFTPPVLAAGSSDFQFVVQSAGLAGGTYTGTVTTVPAPGSNDSAEDVPVWILIP